MPGLDFMLFNQVTPLLCIDKNLLTANALKLELSFPKRTAPFKFVENFEADSDGEENGYVIE